MLLKFQFNFVEEIFQNLWAPNLLQLYRFLEDGRTFKACTLKKTNNINIVLSKVLATTPHTKEDIRDKLKKRRNVSSDELNKAIHFYVYLKLYTCRPT